VRGDDSSAEETIRQSSGLRPRNFLARQSKVVNRELQVFELRAAQKKVDEKKMLLLGFAE
jgi:hypothetical protein